MATQFIYQGKLKVDLLRNAFPISAPRGAEGEKRTQQKKTMGIYTLRQITTAVQGGINKMKQAAKQGEETFALGDVVRATAAATQAYNVTKEGWEGVVIAFPDGSAGSQMIVYGLNEYADIGKFAVYKRHFSLVRRKDPSTQFLHQIVNKKNKKSLIGTTWETNISINGSLTVRELVEESGGYRVEVWDGCRQSFNWIPDDRSTLFRTAPSFLQRQTYLQNKTIEGKKREVSSLTHSLPAIRSNIVTLQQQEKDNERKIQQLQKEIQKTKIQPYTKRDWEKDLQQIKKHPLVEDAYLSIMGNIIVLTKTLHATTEDGEERGELGKFCLRISYRQNYRFVSGENLTFKAGESGKIGHPNLKHGCFCLDDTQDILQKLLEKREYFLFVETLICFLCQYEAYGTPHMSMQEFLLVKKRVTALPTLKEEKYVKNHGL